MKHVVAAETAKRAVRCLMDQLEADDGLPRQAILAGAFTEIVMVTAANYGMDTAIERCRGAVSIIEVWERSPAQQAEDVRVDATLPQADRAGLAVGATMHLLHYEHGLPVDAIIDGAHAAVAAAMCEIGTAAAVAAMHRWMADQVVAMLGGTAVQ